MNKSFFTGWLTADAEVRSTPSGHKVLIFSLLVDRERGEPEDAEQVMERIRVDDPLLVRLFEGELLASRAVSVECQRKPIPILKNGVIVSTVPTFVAVDLRVPNRSAPPKSPIVPALKDAAA